MNTLIRALISLNVLLSSCAGEVSSTGPPPPPKTELVTNLLIPNGFSGGTLYRYRDELAVCYIASQSNSVSISCMPVTRIPIGR